jgi:hypothetical protein
MPFAESDGNFNVNWISPTLLFRHSLRLADFLHCLVLHSSFTEVVPLLCAIWYAQNVAHNDIPLTREFEILSLLFAAWFQTSFHSYESTLCVRFSR